MKTAILTAAAVLLLTTATPAQEGGKGFGSTKLVLGMLAPQLGSIEVIKGEAPGEWQPGHVYVLDFWATWCTPCIDSIPHMTSIAKRWADQDVHVIGTAIWPRKNMTPVAEFVAEYDQLMGYTVAKDIGRRSARDLVEAAGQYGIPYVVVVDGEGRIAWTGHPMDGLSLVLEDVVAGTFDLAEFERRKTERMARADVLIEDFQKAAKAEDWDALVKITDELVSLDESMSGQFAFFHYVALLRQNKPDEAARYGRVAVQSSMQDSAPYLERMARLIVEPLNLEPIASRDMDLALMAAERANVLTRNRHPSVLDTLARVHFLTGNLDAAVELQRHAVLSATDGPLRDQLQGRMDEYLRARPTAGS
jgi:thiol-disulfide isomerase/thioredoxin